MNAMLSLTIGATWEAYYFDGENKSVVPVLKCPISPCKRGAGLILPSTILAGKAVLSVNIAPHRIGSSSADMLEAAIDASKARNGELGKWALPHTEWPRGNDGIQRIINDTTSHIALFLPLSYYKNRTNILCNPMAVINLQEEAQKRTWDKNSDGFEEIRRFLGGTPENKLIFRKNDTLLRTAFDELILWAREFGFASRIERTTFRKEMQLQYVQLKQETSEFRINGSTTKNHFPTQSSSNNCSAEPLTSEKHTAFDYQTGLRLTDNHLPRLLRPEKVALKLENLASAIGFYVAGIILSFLSLLAEIWLVR